MVSLFTREWIEILSEDLSDISDLVSLFTREWIEIYEKAMNKVAISTVSLFTREWIEIHWGVSVSRNQTVSLFTREWIEIWVNIKSKTSRNWSPSLRGSGLKFPCGNSCQSQNCSLPLYEGVD